MHIEKRSPNFSVTPKRAKIDTTIPIHPKIRNARFLWKKEKMLGLFRNLTNFTYCETGNNPFSPSSGLN